MSRMIHCRYCGTDNEVASDVVGKFCELCNQAIYSRKKGSMDGLRCSRMLHRDYC